MRRCVYAVSKPLSKSVARIIPSNFENAGFGVCSFSGKRYTPTVRSVDRKSFLQCFLHEVYALCCKNMHMRQITDPTSGLYGISNVCRRAIPRPESCCQSPLSPGVEPDKRLLFFETSRTGCGAKASAVAIPAAPLPIITIGEIRKATSYKR